MKNSALITLEGIDFSGKTTQAKKLIRLLKKLGLNYLFLREPGGTRLSERVRRILLNRGELAICPKSELWLYLAARSQIVEEKIRPALNAGKIVICDRFYDSTLAYQGFGRELNRGLIETANEFAVDGLKPDLTLLFDLPEQIAFERKNKMRRVKDRLEKEKLAFFKKVRQGYLAIADANPSRIKIIDANYPSQQVEQEMADIVIGFLRKRKIGV